MSKILRRTVLVSLLAAALAVVPALAAEPSGDLAIADAWIRKPPPGLDSAAMYFTVQNRTTRPIALRGVTSPIAAHAMIHETTVTGGQSRMRMRDNVTVPPRGRLVFAPEGLHVMLTALKKPLEVGDKVPVALEVDHGTVIHFEATVRPLDAK